ncbi:hypothetical protein [Pseudactinotalea sp. Z1748]|uniref:hypothetical protein n=1 Tax=Pseudactinotalea sp. Z1748 TaxID=3413027 RepID=UPI003C7B7311
MRYRQISTHPEPGTVERLTIVPVLPDGTLGALAGTGVGTGAANDDASPDRAPLTLIHGEVEAEEDWYGQAVARISAERAGFAVDRVELVAAEGLAGALHLIVWADGDLEPVAEEGSGSQRPAALLGLAPDELRLRVATDQGIIPGGASPAWIVADVAASIATSR